MNVHEENVATRVRKNCGLRVLRKRFKFRGNDFGYGKLRENPHPVQVVRGVDNAVWQAFLQVFWGNGLNPAAEFLEKQYINRFANRKVAQRAGIVVKRV